MRVRCPPRRIPFAAIAVGCCGVWALALGAPMAAFGQAAETAASADAWSHRIVQGAA